MIFAPYTGYIFACYALVFVVFCSFGAYLFVQNSRLKGQLNEGTESLKTSAHSRKRKWVVALFPLIVFAALVGVFAQRLQQGQVQNLPSALVGKTLPKMDLPALEGLMRNGQAVAGLQSENITSGKLTLLNVFASWCGPCRAEHPFLEQLAQRGDVRLVGLNYKDKPENALDFLNKHGNPYAAVGSDRKGRSALDLGVYGVPETFLVSADGRILARFTGPIDAKRLQVEVVPQIEKALQAPMS